MRESVELFSFWLGWVGYD
jgi:hypothetical protein